jgi:hypothetical protein
MGGCDGMRSGCGAGGSGSAIGAMAGRFGRTRGCTAHQKKKKQREERVEMSIFVHTFLPAVWSAADLASDPIGGKGSGKRHNQERLTLADNNQTDENCLARTKISL